MVNSQPSVPKKLQKDYCPKPSKLRNLLHIDLFGLTRTTSMSGKHYGLVVVDDCSRWTCVVFLTYKDESFKVIRSWLALKKILNLNKKTRRSRMLKHLMHYNSYQDFKRLVENLIHSYLPRNHGVHDFKAFLRVLGKHLTQEDPRELSSGELVAQGYYLLEGIYFIETFDLVARLEVIYILLSFAAHNHMRLHQMNVKCVFLNCIINEEAYVK
ncbi:hypothetical protein CR513_47949, partial [Mucuna pruriens]